MTNPDHCIGLDMAERRRQTRRPIMIRATVRIPGKPDLPGHAVDLSPGGLGLLSPVALALDEELVMNIPFEICGEQRTVVIAGRVRYCTRQTEQCFRIGLQFVHLDADTARFIASVCS